MSSLGLLLLLIDVLLRAPRDELRQLVQAGGGLVSHQARIAQVVLLIPMQKLIEVNVLQYCKCI